MTTDKLIQKIDFLILFKQFNTIKATEKCHPTLYLFFTVGIAHSKRAGS